MANEPLPPLTRASATISPAVWRKFVRILPKHVRPYQQTSTILARSLFHCEPGRLLCGLISGRLPDESPICRQPNGN